MAHSARFSARANLNVRFGVCLAITAALLPCGALAQQTTAPTRLAIKQNIVELPTELIPLGKKAAFVVTVSERESREKILLRFEAILRFDKEAGYSPVARISVGGVVLDESHFPVNWVEQRTWSLPNIRPRQMPLYRPEANAWTVRYDCDRWPPVKQGFYYSPEMAGKYVYMFPIGDLLKAGENRIKIENLGNKSAMQLFSCAESDRATIADVRCSRITDRSIAIAWKADLPRYEIDYRPAGQTTWQTVRNVLPWENPYTVILLEPATDYEFRIRGLPQPTADLEGNVVTPKPVGSTVVKAATKAQPKPKAFAGFQLYPTAPVPGGLSTYPCIENHDGFLWLTDCRLFLSKLDPEAKTLLWKAEQPMATWPLPPPSGYMGIPDTTIHENKLWVTYNVQATGNPKGYHITQSRQYLLSRDFTTGKVSESVFVKPTKPEFGSWEGGVESWRGKLWVMHLDVWTEGDVRRTRIVLRTFAHGKFGPAIVYENCPTVYPYGPSISVFDDKLLLLFSDLAATEKDSKREPLLYTLFDGKTFSKARVLQDTGRSRYGKGVQIGDRFLCAYKCSAPYFEEHGYQYHDIALTLFQPGTDANVQTTMYVDDRKYNSSPDVVLAGDRIFVVYNKFEHLYGDRANPATFYGSFIGRIDPVARADKEKK